jgi:hypothetical protein
VLEKLAASIRVVQVWDYPEDRGSKLLKNIGN